MKNLGVIVTIVLACIGGLGGYFTLQANQETTKEKVEKIEKEIKETEEKVQKNEIVDVKQSMLIESSLKIIDKLEQKLEK